MVKYISHINVDKKFVAGVYKENNLMETLSLQGPVLVLQGRHATLLWNVTNAFGVQKESGHLI